MRILHVIMFCCFSEASAVLEVTGRVGAKVSIHCSGSWTTNSSSQHHNMHFCKGVCSNESILIQTASNRSAVTRRGRYGMEASGGDGAFSVTMKRLQRTDAGTYHCGVEGTHQEVKLMVLDASTVPLGSPPSTTPLQTATETLPQGSSVSGTEPSAAASTLAEDTTNQTAATNLKDTTVVIIVSVSLALLVCAIIPLIFYRHWWSNAEGQNKGEPEYCEGNADVASAQAAVRLQSLDADPESGIHNSSHYASVYQALNPKTLD